MYRPVEFGPSPALLYRSNLMATLLGDARVSKPTAVGAERGRRRVLNGKGDAVGGRIGQLEGEIGGERWIFTGVAKKALPASFDPPSVNCSRKSSRSVLPLNCIGPWAAESPG